MPVVMFLEMIVVSKFVDLSEFSYEVTATVFFCVSHKMMQNGSHEARKIIFKTFMNGEIIRVFYYSHKNICKQRSTGCGE
jgi:hypothetical protein